MILALLVAVVALVYLIAYRRGMAAGEWRLFHRLSALPRAEDADRAIHAKDQKAADVFSVDREERAGLN
jgi:hypothetical protein